VVVAFMNDLTDARMVYEWTSSIIADNCIFIFIHHIRCQHKQTKTGTSKNTTNEKNNNEK